MEMSGLSWTEVSGVEQQRNVINSCEDKQKSNISFPTVQCSGFPIPNPQSRAGLYLIMIYNGLVIMTWSCVTSCFPSASTTSPFCPCSEESRWPRFNQNFYLFIFFNRRLHPSWSCLQLSLQHQIHAVLAHQRSDPRLHGNNFTMPWRCIHGREKEWERSAGTMAGAAPPLSVPPALFTSCPAHWWGDYLTQIWGCNCLRGVCLPSSFEFHLIVVTVILVITRLRLRWAVAPVAPPILCHMLP